MFLITIIVNAFVLPGHITLCLKTAERAQFPARLWEKIELPSDKNAAKHIIKDKMQYWSKWQQVRVMQRYIRMLQVQGRIRRIRLREKFALLNYCGCLAPLHVFRPAEQMIKKQVERKMKRKELKALRAAKIEETLKQALLERLSTVCLCLNYTIIILSKLVSKKGNFQFQSESLQRGSETEGGRE